ncbi:tyrosine-type recombinase/integrase [Trichocoleus sp. FACHB-262]|uniref:tyrosine-type recombinase/integrase n=1 Tax=Trichocoleus sp. FACHB-262 TaxID=2692869 RepID=UPI0016887DB9|nr:tyrosine-type recombinase/integrase [Trichocoleus sp. FACHB-262]MBD2122409.1 tyrosine-type recombinase/integrase [Trichocoleus sp. FACHB-262]
MGIDFPPSANWFTANFEAIKHPWLKKAAKEYLRFDLSTKAANTCLSKLDKIKKFAVFLNEQYPEISSQNVNRKVVVDFLVYLKNYSRELARETLIVLDDFIGLADRFNWLDITNPNLVFKEDLPRLQKSGKTFEQIIPEEVLEQLVNNLDGLWWQHARMIIIMMAAPIRVSEVCGMRLDCLRQDSEGDWWLHFWDYKLDKEHNPIPLQKEVANMIQLQQKFIKDTFSSDYEYLFCSRSGGRRKDGTFGYEPRAPYADTFRQALRKLVQDRQITYNGEPYTISKTHRFRHTGASELINRGMPLVMVQDILGHESPEMTLVYAKLYDKTLKDAWKQSSSNIVDITGAVVNIERTKLDSPKHKEMKKKMLEQQVHNGHCTLPAIQSCPKFHACYSCAYFRPSVERLTNLKNDKAQLYKEIKQFEAEALKCQEAGQVRMAEGYRTRATQAKDKIEALDKLLNSLEVPNDAPTA